MDYIEIQDRHSPSICVKTRPGLHTNNACRWVCDVCGRALIRRQQSYYSAEQAFQYLQRIGLTECDYSVHGIAQGNFPANLANLEVIVRRHFLSFVNDTTLMHYSAEHYLDITPEATFKRLVADRKGGTYCYGHHNLMLGILRALGYRSYSGMARMNIGFHTGGEANYLAYGHMILFVQLGDGQGSDAAHTWLVDCAPGPPLPMLPIPLCDDPDNIIQCAVPGEYCRLTRGFSPTSSLAPPRPDASCTLEEAARIKDAYALWQVEYCGSGKATDFVEVYQFSEQEFTMLDYNVQHYAEMFKPFHDIFSDDVVCAKFALSNDDDNSGRPVTQQKVERWTLFRRVFRRRLGTKVLEKIECESEDERVNVLRKYFGVVIEDKDINHIESTAASWDKLTAPHPDAGDLL